MAPLVTVGMTCFNAADTIGRAIDSALAQDWPDLEVIVVDDGSSDDSRAIVARRAEADARVRLVGHDRNMGCAAARNTLVTEARGTFLAFFDDDDVSAPGRLRLQHDRIVAHEDQTGSDLVACYASGLRLYPNGYQLPLHAVGSRPRPPVGLEVVDYLLCARRHDGVFYGAGTPTCSLMARTDVFRRVGGFDPAMRRQEDVDFAVRLGFLGGHFIGIADPVLTQYATGGSDKGAAQEHESFLRLLEKNRDHLVRQGDYDYMRRWARLRFRHFNGQRAAAVLALLPLFAHHPWRTAGHFARAASKRFLHERRMKA